MTNGMNGLETRNNENMDADKIQISKTAKPVEYVGNQNNSSGNHTFHSNLTNYNNTSGMTYTASSMNVMSPGNGLAEACISSSNRNKGNVEQKKFDNFGMSHENAITPCVIVTSSPIRTNANVSPLLSPHADNVQRHATGNNNNNNNWSNHIKQNVVHTQTANQSNTLHCDKSDHLLWPSQPAHTTRGLSTPNISNTVVYFGGKDFFFFIQIKKILKSIFFKKKKKKGTSEGNTNLNANVNELIISHSVPMRHAVKRPYSQMNKSGNKNDLKSNDNGNDKGNKNTSSNNTVPNKANNMVEFEVPTNKRAHINKERISGSTPKSDCDKCNGNEQVSKGSMELSVANKIDNTVHSPVLTKEEKSEKRKKEKAHENGTHKKKSHCKINEKERFEKTLEQTKLNNGSGHGNGNKNRNANDNRNSHSNSKKNWAEKTSFVNSSLEMNDKYNIELKQISGDSNAIALEHNDKPELPKLNNTKVDPAPSNVDSGGGESESTNSEDSDDEDGDDTTSHDSDDSMGKGACAIGKTGQPHVSVGVNTDNYKSFMSKSIVGMVDRGCQCSELIVSDKEKEKKIEKQKQIENDKKENAIHYNYLMEQMKRAQQSLENVKNFIRIPQTAIQKNAQTDHTHSSTTVHCLFLFVCGQEKRVTFLSTNDIFSQTNKHIHNNKISHKNWPLLDKEITRKKKAFYKYLWSATAVLI
ncbi:PHD zinc finger-containing protein [Reticulomyxa filosa]|uniref:PHD zinc finger-containing protein n=1 Tax=Reticulomyxa filosa TaxID=46433 RepID=X6NR65_RETFI|nr:PHD zinc finger-containing protein [Reticulomyxa filosa]|eukprot:ETO28224.1 PHD zinc finger-containing protein [Reticulomyxa filosa]